MRFIRFTGDKGKIGWLAGFGAAGALLAALLGEGWLIATRGASPPVSISLLLDCSGSMDGPKLEEMKNAAVEFVERRALSNARLNVVSFAWGSKEESPLSTDRMEAVAAIRQLHVYGGTNMDAGLQVAKETLSAAPGQRFIVLFTDGMPNVMQTTLQEAERCRSDDITVIAVATEDADKDYLAQLTGDPQLVFRADPGQFSRVFKEVGQRLHDLVSTSATDGGAAPLARIGVWTALLACGIGLALIAGQNLYLGRRALTQREAAWGAAGCLTAGAVAGLVGQLAFSKLAAPAGILVFLGRGVGWLLMGALLGLGLARFVPNLKLHRGMLGGAIGGALGVVGFGLVALLLAETPGRWVGAMIVGACIGAIIAWIDALWREAWLEVEYGPGEVRTVSLGREPVTVSSVAGKCTVFVPASSPTTLRYQLQAGQVVCEEVEQGRQTIVQPDQPRRLGQATLRVKGQTAAGRGTADHETYSAPSERRPPRWINLLVQWWNRRTLPSKPASPGENTSPTRATNVGGSIVSLSRSDAKTATEVWLLQVGLQQIPLRSGALLDGRMIPGLEPEGRRDVVAEVVPHPQEPGVLGLKNRSRIAWEATTEDGKTLSIAPERSVRVAAGTTLRFGGTDGKIVPG